MRTGTAPPIAPRLEMTNATPPEVSRDSDGIALGGIRTPPVDVPVDVLSGVPGTNPALICLLLGSTTPLADARLAELYANSADYQQKYATGTDDAIQSGLVLEPDRDLLIAYSQPSRITP